MTNTTNPTILADRFTVYVPTEHLDDSEALALATALADHGASIQAHDGSGDEPITPVATYLSRTIDGRVCNLTPDDAARTLAERTAESYARIEQRLRRELEADPEAKARHEAWLAEFDALLEKVDA